MAEPYLSQIQTQKQIQTLAPQLRQSLETLQVPILELRTLVEQELENNPTLDDLPEEHEQLEIESNDDGAPDDLDDLNFKEQFEVLSRLDDDWRDSFRQNIPTRSSKEAQERREHLFNSLTQTPSLQEHLLEQLNMLGLDELQRQLGEMIIGSITDEGFLTTSIEDLASSTGFDSEQLRPLLFQIQEFDPIGVGARDIRECLYLQLRRLGYEEESPEVRLVVDHLKQLGGKKYPQIARALKTTVDDVSRMAVIIGNLDPKPGHRFFSETAPYVLPEVTIEKVEGQYVIITSDDQIPHLRISDHYRRMIEDPSTSDEARAYVRQKIQAGAFLIKSIGQRQQTIRRITEQILDVQIGFFDHGISELKPLTMAEVADRLDIHETTVSRAIANKYISTPQGTYEMKFFFTPGFKTADGKEMSNKAIKDLISQMVAEEEPTSPLSDQSIVTALTEKGLKVARRTVAKYRDELGILPSHLRKTFG